MSERVSLYGRQPTWRRRLIGGLTAYVVVLVALQALGFSPSAALFAALFVVVVSGVAYLDDRMTDTQPQPWPVQGASTLGLGRGADHKATALARRLSTVRESTEGTRASLARDLHAQLSAVIADKVNHVQGRDVLADRATALELLPPDLAAFVLNPPDERQLTEPAPLTQLLDRIESM